MEFLFIASTHFLALLSPGPDFFLITRAALRLPCKYSIAICAGIAAANGIYLICAISGLELVRESILVITLLRYCGALYLLFIGLMLILSPRHSPDEQPKKTAFLDKNHLGKQFTVGFMSGILNPKNAIFYLSLFTVMVSDTTPLATRWLYGCWMTSIVFFWDCFVVLFMSRLTIKRPLGDTVFYIEKLTGVVLAGFGIALPFT